MREVGVKPFIKYFLFALCLIFFKNINVYASVPTTLPPSPTILEGIPSTHNKWVMFWNENYNSWTAIFQSASAIMDVDGTIIRGQSTAYITTCLNGSTTWTFGGSMWDAEIVDIGTNWTFISANYELLHVDGSSAYIPPANTDEVQNNIDTWNFEGFKIKSPLVDASINSTSFKVVCYARIKSPVLMGDGGLIIESQPKIEQKFKENLKVSLNGTEIVVSPILKWFTYMDTDVNSLFYDFEVSFNVPVAKTGVGKLDVYSKFLTENHLITGDTYVEYSDTRNFNFVAFVDKNGDGVDDNTGQVDGAPKISDVPQRSDYVEGIVGDVQYLCAIFVYYITLPFKSIATVFTTLISSLTETISNMGEVGGFLGSVFGFLPSPIIALMTVAISFLVVGLFYRLFGRK